MGVLELLLSPPRSSAFLSSSSRDLDLSLVLGGGRSAGLLRLFLVLSSFLRPLAPDLLLVAPPLPLPIVASYTWCLHVLLALSMNSKGMH